MTQHGTATRYDQGLLEAVEVRRQSIAARLDPEGREPIGLEITAPGAVTIGDINGVLARLGLAAIGPEELLIDPRRLAWQIGAMEIDHAALERICARNDVARLRVFGSVARGEDTPESDLDLLVDFAAPKSLLDLVGLEQELQDFFGRRVDLLTPASLSPYLQDRILAEARTLYERRAA